MNTPILMQKNISSAARIALALITFFLVSFSPAREAIDVGAVLDDTVQMLEQVDPAMAAQMKNITPEQQKELEHQLNVVFDKMGSMSPEELKYLEAHPEEMFDFVEKTVGEKAAAEKAPEPTTEPIPAAEQKPEVKPTPTPVRTTQETLKTTELLEKIITITEEFILKTTTLKLETKINRWAEKNKINNWQSSLTYKKFKEQLLTLVKKLRAITQERDPETKQLVYIDALTKNTALLNSLQKLHTTLTTQWANATFPERDFDSLVLKLSRETKQALRTMLGAYAQALMAMPAQLDMLMKGYESRSKELREKEAQLTDKARKERKLPGERPMRDGGSSRYDNYGKGYQPSSYDSGYSPYGSDYGGYNPYGSYPGSSSDGDSGKSSGGGGSGGGLGKAKDDSGDGKRDKNLSDVTPRDRKDRAQELAKEDLKDLEKYLLDAQESITSHDNFLSNPSQWKQDEKNAKLLQDCNTITDKVTRAHKSLERIEHGRRLFDKKAKEQNTKKVTELWEKYKTSFVTAQSTLEKGLNKSAAKPSKAKISAGEKKTSATTTTKTPAASSTPTVSSTTVTPEEETLRLFGELPFAVPIEGQRKASASAAKVPTTPATTATAPTRIPESSTADTSEEEETETTAPASPVGSLYTALTHLINDSNTFTKKDAGAETTPGMPATPNAAQ